METDSKSSKIHPLTAAAAIALILACLVGIAAMMGILPNFNKNATPTVNPETVSASTSASAPALPSVAATSPTAAPAPKIAHKKPAKPPSNTASSYSNNPPKQISTAPPPCPNCGVVESVNAIQQQAPATGIGAGVGALLGGVLGHQVGGGNGRTLATVAGAVGGGLAGNAIEKNTHKTTSYEVIVRMEDGSRQRFMMNEQRWQSGDLVRVDNGNLSSRN